MELDSYASDCCDLDLLTFWTENPLRVYPGPDTYVTWFWWNLLQWLWRYCILCPACCDLDLLSEILISMCPSPCTDSSKINCSDYEYIAFTWIVRSTCAVILTSEALTFWPEILISVSLGLDIDVSTGESKEQWGHDPLNGRQNCLFCKKGIF